MENINSIPNEDIAQSVEHESDQIMGSQDTWDAMNSVNVEANKTSLQRPPSPMLRFARLPKTVRLCERGDEQRDVSLYVPGERDVDSDFEYHFRTQDEGMGRNVLVTINDDFLEDFRDRLDAIEQTRRELFGTPYEDSNASERDTDQCMRESRYEDSENDEADDDDDDDDDEVFYSYNQRMDGELPLEYTTSQLVQENMESQSSSSRQSVSLENNNNGMMRDVESRPQQNIERSIDNNRNAEINPNSLEVSQLITDHPSINVSLSNNSDHGVLQQPLLPIALVPPPSLHRLEREGGEEQGQQCDNVTDDDGQRRNDEAYPLMTHALHRLLQISFEGNEDSNVQHEFSIPPLFGSLHDTTSRNGYQLIDRSLTALLTKCEPR